MIFYILGECPACVGSGDLLALVSNKNDDIFCYCPACGLAWDEVPKEVNEMNGMDFYAPDGARPAKLKDIQDHDISSYSETDVYENFDEIL